MRTQILAVIAVFISFLCGNAQSSVDVIEKWSGETIGVHVTNEDNQNVYYTYPYQTQQFTLNKSYIKKVKMANGSEKTFSQFSPAYELSKSKKWKIGEYRDGWKDKEIVTIYEHHFFKGRRQAIGPGTYNSSRLGVFDNKISSIEIPEGVKIKIYEGGSFSGESKELTKSTQDVGEAWNDKISSIEVIVPGSTPIVVNTDNNNSNINYPGGGSDNSNSSSSTDNNNNSNNTGFAESDGKVILYQFTGYRGLDQVVSTGKYNNYQITLGDNKISSIRIPLGYKVVVYRDANFLGKTAEFTSSVDDLGSEWDNHISSLEVISTTANYNPSGSGSSSSTVNDNFYIEGAIVYFKKNYDGGRKSLTEGKFNASKLSIFNHNISSIRIGKGYKLRVYRGNYFDGQMKEYITSQEQLFDWDNEIGSVEVIKQ